jgi:3-oxoacyl-[acyl-carrier protein] reductase
LTLTSQLIYLYSVYYINEAAKEIAVDTGRLAGQVAVVTGASRGIGAAIAERLARDGASVAVNYLTSEQAAASVVESIVSSGGKARAFKADVYNPAQAKALIQWAAETLGPVDILVNNAADGPTVAPLEAIEEAHVHSAIQHTMNGPIFVTQAAVAHLSRSRSGDGWSISAGSRPITRSQASRYMPRAKPP